MKKEKWVKNKEKKMCVYSEKGGVATKNIGDYITFHEEIFSEAKKFLQEIATR